MLKWFIIRMIIDLDNLYEYNYEDEKYLYYKDILNINLRILNLPNFPNESQSKVILKFLNQKSTMIKRHPL